MTTGSASKSENHAYGGITWAFATKPLPDKPGPYLVPAQSGVRNAKVMPKPELENPSRLAKTVNHTPSTFMRTTGLIYTPRRAPIESTTVGAAGPGSAVGPGGPAGPWTAHVTSCSAGKQD